ncbi:bifunctional riboflavin kinase/FAD synthetase [beta proteobacterium MWH-UniP1]
MLIFQGISPQKASRSGRAITIGNFDGVHMGHQALINQTLGLAREQQLTSAVVTFEPHPKAFFAPAQAPKKIQGLRGKANALSDLGVNELWILRFRRSLADMSANDFMEKFLHQGVNAKVIVIGDDFCFGAKRQGNFELLKSVEARYGWTVHRVPTISVGGSRASSSLLRDCLAKGDLQQAEQLMGRPYSLSGHVIHGRALGRNLGFPTLNVPVHHNLVTSGVFVVSVSGLAEEPIPGVASLGHRPTVEQQGRLLLEAHLFDWSGDAYGKIVQVTFHKKLRDEIRYTDIHAMTQQIQLDARQARDYFSHYVD